MSVLLAVWAVTMATIGIGMVRYADSARRTVVKQITLDRCVGRVALDVRDLARQVETMNSTLKTLRAALATGGWWPPTGAKLRAAIQAVYLAQEARVATWWIVQAAWLARRCGRGGVVFPFGGPPWKRPPPDVLGPPPLSRVTQSVAVRAISAPLTAAATVEWAQSGWRAHWVPWVLLP